MNLHICLDGNFIKQAMDVFEYFFPGENVFIVFNFREPRKYREDIPIYRYDRDDSELLSKVQSICSKYLIKNVLNHGLSYSYISIFQYLKKNELYSGRIYWIYWGYELYNALGETGKCKLIDKSYHFTVLNYMVPNPINALLKRMLGINLYSDRLEKALPYIDYFCGWFPYDFKLLHKHYDTNVKFKYFKYISDYKTDNGRYDIKSETKVLDRIMVNHQASLTGNHKTIFRKLSTIPNIENFTIYTPLSYGHNVVRKHVLKAGKYEFGKKYKAILNLMSFDEYDRFLSLIPVAIFGAIRQEAAGNIMALLKKGAKVYLREKNPLLQFYREKGFIICSFEEDLNDVTDLEPLLNEEQLHNMRVARDTQIYYEDFMKSFFD